MSGAPVDVEDSSGQAGVVDAGPPAEGVVVFDPFSAPPPRRRFEDHELQIASWERKVKGTLLTAGAVGLWIGGSFANVVASRNMDFDSELPFPPHLLVAVWGLRVGAAGMNFGSLALSGAAGAMFGERRAMLDALGRRPVRSTRRQLLVGASLFGVGSALFTASGIGRLHVTHETDLALTLGTQAGFVLASVGLGLLTARHGYATQASLLGLSVTPVASRRQLGLSVSGRF